MGLSNFMSYTSHNPLSGIHIVTLQFRAAPQEVSSLLLKVTFFVWSDSFGSFPDVGFKDMTDPHLFWIIKKNGYQRGVGAPGGGGGTIGPQIYSN
jgi:hypothetical protein